MTPYHSAYLKYIVTPTDFPNPLNDFFLSLKLQGEHLPRVTTQETEGLLYKLNHPRIKATRSKNYNLYYDIIFLVFLLATDLIVLHMDTKPLQWIAVC